MTKKENEKQKLLIPIIENPSIRIDVDVSLRDIDFYITSRIKHVAPDLAIDWGFYDDDDDITGLHPSDLDPALLQNLREESDKLKIQWKNEKEVIAKINDIKKQMEHTKLEAEKAEKRGDLEKAAELTYGVLNKLKKDLEENNAKLADIQKIKQC